MKIGMECTDLGEVASSFCIYSNNAAPQQATCHERWAAEPQDVDKLTPQGRATTACADVDIMAGALPLSDTQSFDLQIGIVRVLNAANRARN